MMQTANKQKITFERVSLVLCGLLLISLVIGLLMDSEQLWKLSAVAASIFLALGLGAFSQLKGFRYTAWIIAAVVAGMIYPSAFYQMG